MRLPGGFPGGAGWRGFITFLDCTGFAAGFMGASRPTAIAWAAPAPTDVPLSDLAKPLVTFGLARLMRLALAANSPNAGRGSIFPETR